MEVKYTIIYQEQVVKKHIPALAGNIKNIIKKAIEDKLGYDPIRFGKPLQYSLKGHRRLRVGDYKVVYRIDTDCLTVIVIAIKHRKDIYDH